MASPDRISSDVDAAATEKATWTVTAEHLEKYRKAGLSQEDAEYLANMSEKEQSRIFHKVDIRLVPMLMILYLISHLDRLVPPPQNPFLTQSKCQHHPEQTSAMQRSKVSRLPST
jgi:hypothetical protein